MALSDNCVSDIQTRFRRYECKYLIGEDQAAGIRAFARPYVVPDPHAAASPDLSYDITSLYLDAPDLRLYRETVEGQLNRIKLRIRHYEESPDSPVFLEIKKRFNGLVLKSRAGICRDATAAILDGGVPDLRFPKSDQQACCEEFAGWVARWRARPMVWVRYRREAYVGTINTDVRVTMDRGLVCAPADDGGGPVRASSWRPVETRLVILEVKFDGSFPGWVAQLVQRFRLEKRSYSKYGHCIQRAMAEDSLPITRFRAMAS
ncbi:MAG: polyphosphate polymerase domain-containing protein [bacterium]|nr:polyphosphate polymerase domain-containing protein [bacterium]